MDTWLTSERELKKENWVKSRNENQLVMKVALSTHSEEEKSAYLSVKIRKGKECPCPCPFTLISAGRYQTETVVHYTTYITILNGHFSFSSVRGF